MNIEEYFLAVEEQIKLNPDFPHLSLFNTEALSLPSYEASFIRSNPYIFSGTKILNNEILYEFVNIPSSLNLFNSFKFIYFPESRLNEIEDLVPYRLYYETNPVLYRKEYPKFSLSILDINSLETYLTREIFIGLTNPYLKDFSFTGAIVKVGKDSFLYEYTYNGLSLGPNINYLSKYKPPLLPFSYKEPGLPFLGNPIVELIEDTCFPLNAYPEKGYLDEVASYSGIINKLNNEYIYVFNSLSAKPNEYSIEVVSLAKTLEGFIPSIGFPSLENNSTLGFSSTSTPDILVL